MTSIWIDAGVPLVINLNNEDSVRIENGQPVDWKLYKEQTRIQLEKIISGRSSTSAKQNARNLWESLDLD